MIGIVGGILGKIGMQVVWSFLSKRVLEGLMWGLMEKFVKHTDNKLDDGAVAKAKKAFYGDEK